MADKYDSLLERSIRAQEQSVNISQSLLEVSKRMEENIKSLNDNFVLHNQKTEEVCKDVTDIKTTLLKWLRIAVIALVIAVGGVSIIKFILDAKLL